MQPPAILIIQEASAPRQGLPTLLRAAGLAFEAVPGRTEAVAALRERPYAMVVFNCGVPTEADLEAGWEMRDLQAQHPEARPVRMVVVIEEGAPRNRERCLAGGMNECLIGPLSPDVLPRLLGEWTLSQLATFPGAAEPLADFEESEIHQAVSQLVTELDAASAVDMLDVLFAELPLQLAALRDLVTGSDRRTFGRMAHSIAGSSGTFGLHDVRLLALEIENVAPTAEQAFLQQKIERLSEMIDASMPELLRIYAALRE